MPANKTGLMAPGFDVALRFDKNKIDSPKPIC
jgi:hypothetical protein